MALKFRLVDLKDLCQRAVSTFAGDTGSGEGHILITTENGQKKIVVVPIQNTVSQDGYSSQWGPCPADLRAENYHDPVVPGSHIAGETGGDYVWVAEQGYVPAETAPGQAAAALATFKARVAQAAVDFAAAKK